MAQSARFLGRLYSEVLAAPGSWLLSSEFFQLMRGSAKLTDPAGLTDRGASAESGYGTRTDLVAEIVPGIERFGGIGVIRVCGVLMKNPPCWMVEMGACDIDQVRMLVEIATIDPTIEQVVLHFQTPGGEVTGVPECAHRIAELRAVKDVTSFSDRNICSGGYFLGCQADQVILTPTARAGGIGVYTVYFEESEGLAMEGTKANSFSVGKLKLAGADWKAMNDEEKAYFQAEVERVGVIFKGRCSQIGR